MGHHGTDKQRQVQKMLILAAQLNSQAQSQLHILQAQHVEQNSRPGCTSTLRTMSPQPRHRFPLPLEGVHSLPPKLPELLLSESLSPLSGALGSNQHRFDWHP